jgi:DNA primase
LPRYADSDKEKIREAVDIVDLVGKRTELRRSGPGQYKGLCPFHEERSPSFSVDAHKGVYHCFGCGVGGDAFKFVQETEGLDFVGAMESLAQRVGIELTVEDEDPRAAERRKARERLLELLERATGFYERYLWESQEAAPARRYLADRGFTEETLRTFRVGYAPSAWDKLLMAGRQGGFGNREIFDAGLAVRSNRGQGRIYDRFRRRIMFPLADARGRVLGFGARALGADQQPKYLNSSDGEIFHKGEIVYGAHLARTAAAKADEVIATEGYMDVLALHQAGIANVVCIMGTSLTERQVGELAKLGKTVLLALDADSAGQEAMLKAAKVAARSKLALRVVPLPVGLDPADVVQQRGVEAAREFFQQSVPFVRFQVERELARGDLSGAEGKDAVIAALRPVFATLPPSALREELVDVVTAGVALERSKVSSWLAMPFEEAPEPARASAPAGGGGGGGGGGTATATQEYEYAAPPVPQRPYWPGRKGDGRRPWDRPPAPEPFIPQTRKASDVALAERAFLAQCVVTPSLARDLLPKLDKATFSSDFMGRLATHLEANLEQPLANIGEDDDQLTRAIAGLLADAAGLSNSPTVLKRELALVELKRLERDHRAAIAAMDGTAAGLRVKVDAAKQRWEELVSQSLEEAA